MLAELANTTREPSRSRHVAGLRRSLSMPGTCASLAALVARHLAGAGVGAHLSWGQHRRSAISAICCPCPARAALLAQATRIDRVQQTLERTAAGRESPPCLQLAGRWGGRVSGRAWLGAAAAASCSRSQQLLHVQARSVAAWRVDDYLATIDLGTVGGIHLAGFTEKHLPQGPSISTPRTPWPRPVWGALRTRSAWQRAIPTLIE